MNQSIKFSCFLFIIFFVASCATVEKTEPAVRLGKTRRVQLLEALDSISLRKPTFFYTKITTKYSDSTTEKSFKTSIRMVKDSAINLLVSYATIPVINSMITKDSLSVVNKIDKCIILEELSFIKESFGVDVMYSNLEEIILGLPLDYDTNQRYFQMHDPNNYVLSSHKKLKIRRNERNAADDIVIQYFLNARMNELVKMEVISPADSTQIEVDYLSREMIENYLVPKEVIIRIKTPRKTVTIDLTYERTEINNRQPLIFIIPEGYEECK